ncbi:MAG: ligand-gated channel protein [Deltaproteobacteria bacterium]
MQGEERNRFRERGSAPRGFHAVACRVALIVASWIAASGSAIAQEPVRTEPVVVTATRIEEKVSEQASSVSVVTREEIEQGGAGYVGDVLKSLPGVDTQRAGTAGNRENIKIRGGKSTQTLVMIDGFPVNSPGTSEFDIGSLTADLFEQVEVVRGPQSALYGSYASGGVVNFLPRKAGGKTRYGLGLSGGSFETVAGSGFASIGGPWGSLHLAGNGYRGDGNLPNDGSELVSFLGSGDLKVGERQRIHLVLLSTDANKEIPIDFGTRRDINHVETRRGFLAGARWEAKLTETLSVSASAGGYDEFLHVDDPPDPTDAFPFPFEDVTKSRKSVVTAQGRYSPGRISTTVVGAEFERDRITDTFNPASTTYSRAAFFQEELRLRDGIGVSAGGRLDRNSIGGTEFNPKFAAYKQFRSVPVKIRAAAGRGFRPPTASEKFDPFIGNPDLSPEVSVSYEAGTDLSLSGGRGSVSATWFFSDHQGLIQFVDTVPGPIGFGEIRNVDAISRGVEMNGTWQWNEFVGFAGAYTYTATWDKTNRQRILGIPNQRGSLSVLVSPGARMRWRVDWRAESDELDAPPNGGERRRPGYARVDLHGRYLWKTGSTAAPQIALTGKVQNVLNRSYEERKEFPAPGIHFLLGAELTL